MRALPSIVLIFGAFLYALTAAAQIDEQPPVIRRSPTSPIGSSQGQPSQSKSEKKQPDNITAEGIVREIDDKTLVVAIDDGRVFKASIDSKTEFTGSAGKIERATVTSGTRVRISVKANNDMDLTATSVVVEKPTAAGESASPEEDAATRHTEDSDPGRPVLKRGMPQKVTKKDDAEDKDDDEEAPASPKAPAAKASAAEVVEPKDESLASALTSENQPDLIKKAREANMGFLAHLPNFVCQQFTTRYERESKIEGWKAKDIISATVVFESKQERYENIKVNNRAAKGDMMDIKNGAQSIGEFGSFLRGLFERTVDSDFRYLHPESFRQVHTKVFTFTVKKEATDWTITLGGQSVAPAYSGRVWIETETGRVMRIERRADNIPESFPIDLIEQTLDYDSVMLGGRKVLLPVESSNLGCQRGSSFCTKNVIQFRDYKEFRGEASVSFDSKPAK